jgi:hypothetical protein
MNELNMSIQSSQNMVLIGDFLMRVTAMAGFVPSG